MSFQRAERKKAKLRLCLSGPSGSGKTYSALKIAMGLGGKIAMIDTENGSGELYAHLTEYDVMQLGAPYSPDRYIQAIKESERLGYNVLIIDSLTHAWTGEGGVLEMVDKAAKASTSGNSFTAWRNVTPKHNQLVDAILTSKLHIITTMRTKTEYVIEENDKGKKTPRKIGMAPIQRDGMEYEFTVVLDISTDSHVASSSKDRTGLFDGKPDVLSENTGKTLLEWLESGKSQEEVEKETYDAAVSRVLDMVNGAESMDELKDRYISLQKDFKNNPKIIEELISAKEQKKLELEKGALQ